VTALGETDTENGWREHKATGGCLVHVPSGEVVLRGLSMPHSPRLYQGQLYLLDSGRGAYGGLGQHAVRQQWVRPEQDLIQGRVSGFGFGRTTAAIRTDQGRSNPAMKRPSCEKVAPIAGVILWP